MAPASVGVSMGISCEDSDDGVVECGLDRGTGGELNGEQSGVGRVLADGE